MDVELKSCFADPLLAVMTFLNEVVLRHPQAISFAPGRPAERHFDVERSLGKIARFVEHRARSTGSRRRPSLPTSGNTTAPTASSTT